MNDMIETGYVQRYNKRDDVAEKYTSKMYYEKRHGRERECQKMSQEGRYDRKRHIKDVLRGEERYGR